MLGWEDHTHPLPQGVGALVSPFLGPADKARLAGAVVHVVRLDQAEVAHLTIEEWLAQMLPETPRAILRTLVRVGTYTADSDTVSADVAVNQLKAALTGVTYLHGGWAQITAGLRAAAPGVRRISGSARSVDVGPEGPVVRTDLGPVTGRRVVLATGSPAAVAALLPTGAPTSWSSLGPPVMASCLDLGLRTPPPIPRLVRRRPTPLPGGPRSRRRARAGRDGPRARDARPP